MEEVLNLIEIVLKYGGTVILAVLFLYVFFSDRKSKEEKEKKKEAELKEEKQNNSAVLKELSASNKNIAESLNLLRVSIDINTTEFRQHDERAITNFNDIEKHLIKIEEQTRK